MSDHGLERAACSTLVAGDRKRSRQRQRQSDRAADTEQQRQTQSETVSLACWLQVTHEVDDSMIGLDYTKPATRPFQKLVRRPIPSWAVDRKFDG